MGNPLSTLFDDFPSNKQKKKNSHKKLSNEAKPTRVKLSSKTSKLPLKCEKPIENSVSAENTNENEMEIDTDTVVEHPAKEFLTSSEPDHQKMVATLEELKSWSASYSSSDYEDTYSDNRFSSIRRKLIQQRNFDEVNDKMLYGGPDPPHRASNSYMTETKDDGFVSGDDDKRSKCKTEKEVNRCSENLLQSVIEFISSGEYFTTNQLNGNTDVSLQSVIEFFSSGEHFAASQMNRDMEVSLQSVIEFMSSGKYFTTNQLNRNTDVSLQSVIEFFSSGKYFTTNQINRDVAVSLQSVIEFMSSGEYFTANEMIRDIDVSLESIKQFLNSGGNVLDTEEYAPDSSNSSLFQSSTDSSQSDGNVLREQSYLSEFSRKSKSGSPKLSMIDQSNQSRTPYWANSMKLKADGTNGNGIGERQYVLIRKSGRDTDSDKRMEGTEIQSNAQIISVRPMDDSNTDNAILGETEENAHYGKTYLSLQCPEYADSRDLKEQKYVINYPTTENNATNSMISVKCRERKILEPNDPVAPTMHANPSCLNSPTSNSSADCCIKNFLPLYGTCKVGPLDEEDIKCLNETSAAVRNARKHLIQKIEDPEGVHTCSREKSHNQKFKKAESGSMKFQRSAKPSVVKNSAFSDPQKVLSYVSSNDESTCDFLGRSKPNYLRCHDKHQPIPEHSLRNKLETEGATSLTPESGFRDNAKPSIGSYAAEGPKTTTSNNDKYFLVSAHEDESSDQNSICAEKNASSDLPIPSLEHVDLKVPPNSPTSEYSSSSCQDKERFTSDISYGQVDIDTIWDKIFRDIRNRGKQGIEIEEDEETTICRLLRKY